MREELQKWLSTKQ